MHWSPLEDDPKQLRRRTSRRHQLESAQLASVDRSSTGLILNTNGGAGSTFISSDLQLPPQRQRPLHQTPLH
uniref:Uncharacterized protein n=1 Tax=Ditylenchus dipsaci TaxID=166011 RepID=A0A915EBI5_9BILA